LPYPAFLLGMLVAGAGLLNIETAKVMQGAVRRSALAWLRASPLRLSLLACWSVGIAELGAMLAQVASRRFITGGVAAGLDAETAAELAKHVTSGDVAGIVGNQPRRGVHVVGN
jgi:hypothetical protein